MINLSRRRFLSTTASSAAAMLLQCAQAAASRRILKPSDDDRRWAFAHYMTGQCTRRRNQSVQDWMDDIRDAQAYGIDGWQFNFGRYRGQFKVNVENFVKALGSLGAAVVDYRFFPSFDCNKGRIPDYQEIHGWFSAYYHHPNHFRLAGLPLLTVWQARHVGDAYFRDVKHRLREAGMPVSFIPWVATKADQEQMAKLFDQWPSMDGFFPWIPGKPATEAVRYNQIAATLCRQHGKTLMAGQGFAMLHVKKAPVYVNKHAAEAITAQMLPFVEGNLKDCRVINVATWNDFGEEHHITPHPPYARAEVKYPVWGHIGYAGVLKYYLAWWKSSKRPALTDDALAFFHRVQMAREGDPPFPYAKYQPDKAQDIVYVTALLKEQGTISVTSGSRPPVHFKAPAGVSHWRTQAAPGAQLFKLTRNGKEVLQKTSGRRIASPPEAPWTWSLYSELAMSVPSAATST